MKTKSLDTQRLFDRWRQIGVENPNESRYKYVYLNEDFDFYKDAELDVLTESDFLEGITPINESLYNVDDLEQRIHNNFDIDEDEFVISFARNEDANVDDFDSDVDDNDTIAFEEQGNKSCECNCDCDCHSTNNKEQFVSIGDDNAPTESEEIVKGHFDRVKHAPKLASLRGKESFIPFTGEIQNEPSNENNSDEFFVFPERDENDEYFEFS